MQTSSVVQSHPSSIDVYIRHGWSLVPIPPGTKGPRTPGWNKKEAALKSQNDLPQGYGIGLAHAYSGTMALDIDDWETAAVELKKHSIDLDQLYHALDAVVIDSGRQGHGKLLYAMPLGMALPSKKVILNNTVIYELRCATAGGFTTQDILPPTIHPLTNQPYRWAGKGKWEQLPQIPEQLMALWNSLLEAEKQRVIETTDSINANWEEIKTAVDCISPDCSRDDWINVGMALHWAGTQTNQLEVGLHLWNEWSQESNTKYPGPAVVLQQWNSFKANKTGAIKLGTLFHIAQNYGWHRPLPDASSLFSSVQVKQVYEGLRPPAPNMDMSLWPETLAARAKEVSEAVGCDPLVPLFAGLGAACGAVDARSRLELMPGFKVPPVLWLMTIGEPADKKSPGSRPMMDPLVQIEQEDRPRYAKEMLKWEYKEKLYGNKKKTYLEKADGEGAFYEEVPEPDQDQLDLESQPTQLKILVNDITSQKLVRHAADRPRGLLCHLDEMNAWVKKLADKNSGEDRSAWIASYESQAYTMDRVGAGTIHCDNFAVSIYGNIQPQVFRANVATLTSDGLLQRFIPAILRGNHTKLGEPTADKFLNKKSWENTLRLVYALPTATYTLAPEAFDEFREFQKWYEQRKQDERILNATTEYMTAYGKLEGTAGRLIFLFHVLENPFSTIVSANVVRRVVELIKSYIIPAFRYALGEVGGMVDDSFDIWLSNFVVNNAADKQYLSLKEIKVEGVKRFKYKDSNHWYLDQKIQEVMMVLESREWVKQVSIKNKETMWAVNPNLASQFHEYRKQIKEAKKRIHGEKV